MNSYSGKCTLDKYLVTTSSQVAPKVFIPKDVPFMIHPDPIMHTDELWLALYEKKWYLTEAEVAECGLLFPKISIKRAELYLGVQQDGSLFFVPVTHSSGLEFATWRTSLLRVIEAAKKDWMIMSSNSESKRFIGKKMQAQTIEPIWPNKDLATLVLLAFGSRVIDEHHASLDGAYSRDEIEIIEEEY